MSKKHKKEKSEAKQKKEQMASLANAHSSAAQNVLNTALADLDQLCIQQLYAQAIDKICQSLPRSEGSNVASVSQYELRLVRVLGALCGEVGFDGDLVSLRGLLSKTPLSVARLVSAAWLRASAATTLFPSSPDLERAIADTVDRGLSDTLRRLQIDAKAQQFTKRQILVDALTSLERELRSLVGAPLDLHVVGTLRQSFMKPFKTPLAQEAVWPFLPEDLRGETQLAGLFQCVSDLKDAGPDDLMEAFESAKLIVGDFISRAEQYGCEYSEVILAGLGRRLRHAIDGFMADSPLAKPASLSVKEVPKKYPLSSAGAKLRVTFQIKNHGPGTAREVLFRVQEVSDPSLIAEKLEWYLGTVGGAPLDITVPITVSRATTASLIMVSVTWKNFDHSDTSEEFMVELGQQRTDVNWEKNLDPYSLEPVDNEAELVGRADVLRELTGLALSRSMGSCYLYGQKRVGKTSVVKTLRDKLQRSEEPNRPKVIYLEPGEFRSADPITTIENLGRTLCRKLREADGRLAHMELPVFKEALAPFIGFLDDVLKVAPEFRGLFVLDEFDELPIGLYKRTEVGDAFFGSLRSVTNRPAFGLILVGSENMRHVIHFQGHALNKLRNIELDYFDRERHWTDFQELVRRPVQGILDIEDDAIVDLHGATSGNPFFTKLICGRLFQTMYGRRDCYVTKIEMHEAMRVALRRDMAINNVQHFWSDGIFEIEAKHEEISLRRRKILLSLAYAGRDHLPINKEATASYCRDKFGLDSHILDQELQDLEVTRKIIRNSGGNVEFVVPFFFQWLMDTGITEIIAVSIDADATLRRSREEEAARIRPEEIVAVTNKWSLGYKGQPISEDRVRSWLQQFGDNTRQRLAFLILKGLKFYSQSEIREKVKEAHGIVTRQLVHAVEEGKRKRGDILISYLDGPGKSGSRYAKVYADENRIYYGNVVERATLGSRLRKSDVVVEAVVFVDDLVGTGKSAAGHFEELAKDSDVIFMRDQVKMFFIAVCGLGDGRRELERRISKLPLQIEVHVCDMLDDQDRVFNDSSRFFQNASERHEALALCKEVGATLERKQPLGYGDTQLAIVFEDTVPNNSLPILWKRRKEWEPLFARD